MILHPFVDSAAGCDRWRSPEAARLGPVLVRAGGDIARRLMARWRARREMARTIAALQALDAQALRDIGADRSEAASIAAELNGAAERTRRRILDPAQVR